MNYSPHIYIYIYMSHTLIHRKLGIEELRTQILLISNSRREMVPYQKVCGSSTIILITIYNRVLLKMRSVIPSCNTVTTNYVYQMVKCHYCLYSTPLQSCSKIVVVVDLIGFSPNFDKQDYQRKLLHYLNFCGVLFVIKYDYHLSRVRTNEITKFKILGDG